MTTEPMAELALDFRAWRGADDMAAIADLANAANRADGVEEHVDAERLLNFYRHEDEHFKGTRDLVLVEHEGTLVAYGWTLWIDTTDGLREHRTNGYVHPDWRGRGVGWRLQDRLEAMARQALAEHPTELPVMLGTWADEGRDTKRRLLESRGFHEVRWFFEMRRDLTQPIEVPPLPDGLEVRPVGTDRASLRRMFDADVEAFRDHWGGFAATDARFEEWLGEPDFDPALFVVGWDGDEIAGGVTNVINRAENAAFGWRHGWLESVFVRRAWRRRGLAAGLVARSLVVLRDAGMDEGWLGVDADNPTGALGVYERAGFTVARRSSAYRRPMEESR